MGLAPDINELASRSKTTKTNKKESKPVVAKQAKKEVSAKPKSHDIAIDGVCDRELICCGGCGKSVGLRYSEVNKFNTPITTIDTSGVDGDHPNVDCIRIPGLNGSGKHRKENSKSITNFISNYVPQKTFQDVVIVVCSFSGGSGSVIGPLLAGEIMRQGKIAIVVGVIDTDSEVDTTNAFNTLRTLDNLTKKRNSYLPVILFDNSKGRHIVDRGIDTVMQRLSSILDEPYTGIDMKDRLKFLKPLHLDGVTGGVKMLNISTDPMGDWEQGMGMVTPPEEVFERMDAAILISSMDEHPNLSTRCHLVYRGYYEDEGTNLIASVGYQVPRQLIEMLNGHIHGFRSMAEVETTDINSEYDIGDEDGSGLIL